VKSRKGGVEQYDLSISINGGGMLYIDIQSEKERDDMIQSIIEFKDGVEHSLILHKFTNNI